MEGWFKGNLEPDILTYMDISTSQEIVDRPLKISEALDDNYIGTFVQILSDEINICYNLDAASIVEYNF